MISTAPIHIDLTFGTRFLASKCFRFNIFTNISNIFFFLKELTIIIIHHDDDATYTFKKKK